MNTQLMSEQEIIAYESDPQKVEHYNRVFDFASYSNEVEPRLMTLEEVEQIEKEMF